MILLFERVGSVRLQRRPKNMSITNNQTVIYMDKKDDHASHSVKRKVYVFNFLPKLAFEIPWLTDQERLGMA